MMTSKLSRTIVVVALLSACAEGGLDDLDVSETESALQLPPQCRHGWLAYPLFRGWFYPGGYVRRCVGSIPEDYCMASPEVDACADALIAAGWNLTKLGIKHGICRMCPVTVQVATAFDPSTCTGDEPVFPPSPCGYHNYCEDEIENGEVCYVPNGIVAKESTTPSPTPTPSAAPDP